MISAAAVLLKDLKCELRAMNALVAVLLFAVTSTIAVSFALGAWGSKPEVSAGLLWLIIYFSAMTGLSRSFVREEESQTAALLKLAAPPNAVYIGKLGFNLALMIAAELVAVPLFLVLSGSTVANVGPFTALLVLGTIGLATGATTAAAMIARASTRGALYAVISFPLLLPVLAVAVHGTGRAMAGTDLAAVAGDMRILVYYCGAVLTASLMLFRFIWED